jgi:hypothetical protein
MAKKRTVTSALAELDARLKIVLPEEYRDTYETVQPVSMGSAGLKYAEDGSVAWDKIWGSFCDLAMAGGPPHKGALLEPGSPMEIETDRPRYDAVVTEICRGVTLATDLLVTPSADAGWVHVDCYSPEMAGWLLRAIVMENVAVRGTERAIDLPASSAFRLEKEIKNVVTVIAKTCHYWMGHMPRDQKRAIARLFAELDAASPLLRPSRASDGRRDAAEAARARDLSDAVYRALGYRTSDHAYSGWIGIECPSVHTAVWMMRALVVNNVLARREGGAVFLPIDAERDPSSARVLDALTTVHALAVERGAA